MAERYADLLTGIFFITLGAVLELWLIPDSVHVPQGLPNLAQSPALWPRSVAMFLILLGCLLALQSRSKRALRDERTASPCSSEHTDRGFLQTKQQGFAAVVLLIPYYFACTAYGLLLPSIVALAIYSLLGGEKRIIALLTISVLFPLGLSVFFIHVAHILIPLGPLDGLL